MKLHPMQDKIENNMIAAKFEAGEDVIENLNKLVQKYSIKSGFIEMGIGMVKDLKIGYWNINRYDELLIDERCELVAFHGSIADDKNRFHIHIGIARKDHKLYGGHFFSGVADPLMEVKITKFDSIEFTRKYNEKSTLNELEIK
jgi:predicted DNA-binding protein with PD1-like motif